MSAFLRELFSDLWRIFKLTAGSIAIPLVLYLLLLWTGVLK
jgi:hypothetical protein